MDTRTFQSRLESVQGEFSASATHLKSHDLTILQILQFSIYCPRTQAGPQNNISYEYAERICYFYGSIKIEEEVERYLNNHQCGAVAVAGEFPNSNLHPYRGLDNKVLCLRCLRPMQYVRVRQYVRL